jgi:hypothetical protein
MSTMPGVPKRVSGRWRAGRNLEEDGEGRRRKEEGGGRHTVASRGIQSRNSRRSSQVLADGGDHSVLYKHMLQSRKRRFAEPYFAAPYFAILSEIRTMELKSNSSSTFVLFFPKVVTIHFYASYCSLPDVG